MIRVREVDVTPPRRHRPRAAAEEMSPAAAWPDVVIWLVGAPCLADLLSRKGAVNMPLRGF